MTFVVGDGQTASTQRFCTDCHFDAQLGRFDDIVQRALIANPLLSAEEKFKIVRYGSMIQLAPPV